MSNLSRQTVKRIIDNAMRDISGERLLIKVSTKWFQKLRLWGLGFLKNLPEAFNIDFDEISEGFVLLSREDFNDLCSMYNIEMREGIVVKTLKSSSKQANVACRENDCLKKFQCVYAEQAHYVTEHNRYYCFTCKRSFTHAGLALHPGWDEHGVNQANYKFKSFKYCQYEPCTYKSKQHTKRHEDSCLYNANRVPNASRLPKTKKPKISVVRRDAKVSGSSELGGSSDSELESVQDTMSIVSTESKHQRPDEDFLRFQKSQVGNLPKVGDTSVEIETSLLLKIINVGLLHQVLANRRKSSKRSRTRSYSSDRSSTVLITDWENSDFSDEDDEPVVRNIMADWPNGTVTTGEIYIF